jgi:capsule polysaccharide export protein KpsE/RkpR
MKKNAQTVAPSIELPSEIEPGIGGFEIEELPQHSDAYARIRLLWERRRLLAWVIVVGLVFSTIIAFLIPKSYESTTRLMPPDSQSGSGMAMIAALAGAGGGAGLSSLAGDLLGMKSSGALFTDVLRSRTVGDRLINRFDLRRVYRDTYFEDARKDLAEHTRIAEDRKSGVLTITVSDRDPRRAAQLAQAYVEELDRLVAEVSTSSARRERLFIEQRLQTVKQELDKASWQFSQYASQNTTIDISAQAKATVEAAARLEGELIAAQSELEAVKQIYSSSHVRVRSLQARVDELRTQLHKIGGEGPDSAGDQKGAQVNSRSQEFPSIRQLPLLGVKWAELYRESKIQETVYELLTKQYELAKIQEAKEIPVVKILDPSNVPEKKSGPHRLVLMGLGTLFAFCSCAVCILAASMWRRLNPRHPMKELSREVMSTFSTSLSRLSGKPLTTNRMH